MLAEALGMTVEELNARISDDEFVRWRALYSVRAEMAKFESKESG